jgi:hypothetical protein
VGSDYHGLKKHISTVKEQQEHQDRKYQSSLYQGTPVRPHLLQLPITGKSWFDPFLQRRTTHEWTFDPTGRGSKVERFRYSPRYSLGFPSRMETSSTDVKETTLVEKYQSSRPSSTHQPRGRSAILPPLMRLPVCLHQKRYVFPCTSYLQRLTKWKWSFW